MIKKYYQFNSSYFEEDTLLMEEVENANFYQKLNELKKAYPNQFTVQRVLVYHRESYFFEFRFLSHTEHIYKQVLEAYHKYYRPVSLKLWQEIKQSDDLFLPFEPNGQ